MDIDGAREWLKFAEADLYYARLGQNDANSLENLIAFHAQQAVEKARRRAEELTARLEQRKKELEAQRHVASAKPQVSGESW